MVVVGGQPLSPAVSTPRKDPVPIVHEAGWAPGRVCRAENLAPTGNFYLWKIRVSRGIALLFLGPRHTICGWEVSSTPRPHSTPGKDPVPILQEVGWAPGPVWTGGKSRPHRGSIPDRPVRSQSLYRLSYRAHNQVVWK